MPSDHHVEVPAEAVEALAKKRLAHRGDWLLLPNGERKIALEWARRDLEENWEVLAPFVRAEERERLTPKCERCGGDGDEAVEGGNAPCGDCYGTGLRHDHCPDCKGEGRVEAGPAGATYSSPCERCKARGYVQAAPSVTQLEAHAAQQERKRIEAALLPLLDQMKEALSEWRDGKAGAGSWLSRVEGEIEAALKEEDH